MNPRSDDGKPGQVLPTSIYGQAHATEASGQATAAWTPISAPSSGEAPLDPLGGTPEPGQVLFGKYVVEGKLGQGGMGSVWLVRHRTLGTQRALKMILSGIAIDTQILKRFRREAQVMAAFSNHPNAVQVHDALVAADAAFIDMEYVPGTSLAQWMRPGVPLPIDWVARILVQLCDVLQRAHDQGIVHRDLSPSNLMLLDGCPPGREHLKVLDFGIAKILHAEPLHENAEALTEAHSFLGKPAYASPEQAVGGAMDGRSDLYTVGVMLFEFLTGYRPFSGSRIKLLHDHAELPPPRFADVNPHAHVPPQVEQVVLQILAKRPDDRPPTARALADAFLRALHEASEVGGLPSNLTTESAPNTTSDDDSRLTATQPMTTALMGGPVHPAGPSFSLPFSRPETAGVETISQPITKPRPARGPRVAGLIGVALLASVAVGSKLYFGWGGGADSGTVSQVGDAPTEIPAPANTIKHPDAWRLAGYDVANDAGTTPDGWPKALDRGQGTDRVRFLRDAHGFYWPEGYEPVSGSGLASDDWPKLVHRLADDVAFVRIPAGTFLMGDPDPTSDRSYGRAMPAHEVRLSGFYLQRSEVTNAELAHFLKETGGDERTMNLANWRSAFDEIASQNPDDAGRHPAARIPWHVASTFARHHQASLPTEAQWEYAARSGDLSFPVVWGNENGVLATDRLANINTIGTLPFETVRADQPFGKDETLHGVWNLAGNVREWCLDIFAPYQADKATNPVVTGAGDGEVGHVLRGASYLSPPEERYTTFRPEPPSRDPAATPPDVGFRLVLICPEPGRSGKEGDNSHPKDR